MPGFLLRLSFLLSLFVTDSGRVQYIRIEWY
jgi:hypothetical protein